MSREAHGGGYPTYRSDYTRSQGDIFFKSREVNSNLLAFAGLYDISDTLAYDARVIRNAPPGFCFPAMSKWLRKHWGFGAVFSL